MVDKMNKRPGGGQDQPSGDDSIFDDVKNTYRDVPDVDAVQARARARFAQDVESAPVFMSAKSRTTWRRGATIAAVVSMAAAMGAVFMLVNPGSGDGDPTFDVATPTATTTQAPSPAGTTSTPHSATSDDTDPTSRTTEPNTAQSNTTQPSTTKAPKLSAGSPTTKAPRSTPKPNKTVDPGVDPTDPAKEPGDQETPGGGSKPTKENYQQLTRNGEFLTPDKSVMCVVYSGGKIICAAQDPQYSPGPTPARCGSQDYGASISSSPTRKAQLDCGSDYLFADTGPALPVGKKLYGPKGLTCTTTSTSVTCHYGSGKNRFTYSQKAIRLS